jgi:hypothetical protein
MLRKYTLYLAGVLGLVLGSVGCGESHAHGGYLDVGWNIDSQSYGGTTCERAGISVVVLSAADAVRTNEKPYFTYFNCVDRGGTSTIMPAGEYSVALYGYPGSPDNTDYVADYQFPITYFVESDYTTSLPEVSLVVP